MQNQEISKQFQRLEPLFQKAYEACGGNIEMQAHWAKYLCVLSAGLIENALKEIYVEFARNKVTKPIANYVSSTLSPIRSPKTQRFLDIAAAFNTDWKDELENFVNTNGYDGAIDSIMNHRHQIAHGKNHNSSITLSQLKEYLDKAIKILEFIEAQCKR